MLKNSTEVIITSDSFAAEAADHIALKIASMATRPVLIGLSGGSTPFPVYRLLARNQNLAPVSQNLFWIQTDERIVSTDDPRSNQKAIKESLFTTSVFPAEQFFAVETNIAYKDINLSYSEKLTKMLPAELAWPCPLDLVILGIGTDGHTASLFPDFAWQKSDNESGFTMVETSAQPEARISVTMKHLLNARNVVFLVSGASKEEVVQKALVDKIADLPAAWLALQRPTTWIISKEASGRLHKGAT